MNILESELLSFAVRGVVDGDYVVSDGVVCVLLKVDRGVLRQHWQHAVQHPGSL